MPIGYGYCQCGCGKKAAVPKRTDPGMGRFAGVPLRFAQGHRLNVPQRGRRGAEVPWWKGGRTQMVNGYIMRQVGIDHPMADKHGRVYEHRLVMADAVGRELTSREHVHHINGDKTDNRLENLKLFPSTAEHHRHHAELRAKARAETCQ